MVGSGNGDGLLEYAKKYNVSDNIDVIGQMNHDQIFDWLTHIDIYIQPSNTEGMPRSLIEAMSVGCLCIASNAGGMPELLDSHFIFHKKKYKEIFNIIYSLNQEDYKVQSVYNYKKALQFNENMLNEKRIKFLQEYEREVKEYEKE